MNKDATYEFDTLPLVDSVPALFALATAVELEAARRYDELAARMQAAGNVALARIFTHLADRAREQKHSMTEWAHRQGIEVDAQPGIRWQSPESLSEEAVADAGGEVLMTPLEALELAVHNQERAFAFYVRIASEAGDPAVREHAEHIANEELEQVALLRLERRRARRRAGPDHGPFPDAGSLRVHLDKGEAAVRDELTAAIAACHAEEFEAVAARLATLFGDRIETQAGTAENFGDALGHVDAALRTTEALYAGIMNTVEHATDEALVCEAQSRAADIVRWCAILGDVHAELRGVSQAPHTSSTHDDDYTAPPAGSEEE